MCGIAGHFFQGDSGRASQKIVNAQVRSLVHRGPDETGFLCDEGLAFGMSRLSIIDLAGGHQPIGNEDRTIWIIFNGEIFNYIELTEELKAKGHCFKTRSDTEAILHAYEEFGERFVSRLNGQFSIAIWDSKKKDLLLVRDRLGIRPLYYSRGPDGAFVFGSEIKALFAYPGMSRELDPRGLDQLFSLWVH